MRWYVYLLEAKQKTLAAQYTTYDKLHLIPFDQLTSFSHITKMVK